jgi:hypothetical protein
MQYMALLFIGVTDYENFEIRFALQQIIFPGPPHIAYLSFIVVHSELDTVALTLPSQTDFNGLVARQHRPTLNLIEDQLIECVIIDDPTHV